MKNNAIATINAAATAIIEQWQAGNLSQVDTMQGIIALALPAQETAAAIAALFAQKSEYADKVGKFVAVENKKGKITASAEKTADVLNASSVDTLKALARDGKGTVGTQARQAILGNAFGLAQLRLAASLNGGQWGQVLPLLVGHYGIACYNRLSMKGKDGAIKYIGAVIKNLEVKFDACETVKAQESVKKQLSEAKGDADNLLRLWQVSEDAKNEALGILTDKAEA